MTREQIKEAVVQALLGVAPETQASALRSDQDLREQLEIDSFDFLNFVIALDKNLSVAIPETDYQKLATLDACVDYLAARMQPKPQDGTKFPEKGAWR
ncbi:MAG TPA: acyl carrier protein [Myxococcales bacterium]|nr:acyl carrier protein [Myxococcales bacterium]